LNFKPLMDDKCIMKSLKTKEKFHHNIAGRRFRIEMVSKKDLSANTRGICDYDNRLIKIDKNLSTPELCDTIIHEAMHGAFPWMEEYCVEEFAENVSRLIGKILQYE